MRTKDTRQKTQRKWSTGTGTYLMSGMGALRRTSNRGWTARYVYFLASIWLVKAPALTPWVRLPEQTTLLQNGRLCHRLYCTGSKGSKRRLCCFMRVYELQTPTNWKKWITGTLNYFSMHYLVTNATNYAIIYVCTHIIFAHWNICSTQTLKGLILSIFLQLPAVFSMIISTRNCTGAMVSANKWW